MHRMTGASLIDGLPDHGIKDEIYRWAKRSLAVQYHKTDCIAFQFRMNELYAFTIMYLIAQQRNDIVMQMVSDSYALLHSYRDIQALVDLEGTPPSVERRNTTPKVVPDPERTDLYMLHTSESGQTLCCVCQTPTEDTDDFTVCTGCEADVCKTCCIPVRNCSECKHCQIAHFLGMQEELRPHRQQVLPPDEEVQADQGSWSNMLFGPMPPVTTEATTPATTGVQTNNSSLFLEVPPAEALPYSPLASDGSLRNPVRGVFSGATPQHATVHEYADLDTYCTICTAEFERDELVCRINCNHLFHEQCWQLYLSEEGRTHSCPNCYGPGIAKAIFRHLGNPGAPTAIRTARRQADRRAARLERRAQRATQNGAVEAPTTEEAPTREEAIMMIHSKEEVDEYDRAWVCVPIDEYFRNKEERAAGREEILEVLYLRGEWEQIFLGQTTIPGKHTMLVDLGSRVNVIGANTEKKLSATAKSFGHETVYTRKPKALLIGGVGEGNARCDYEASIPIAVKCNDRPATKETYQANVAHGCGADLPAILGADSMQKKDGVLLLREGKECIVLPGPGGYSINWSPGTRILPMKKAPSGHLVVECDNFDVLDSKNNSDAQSFWTDHRNPQDGEQLLTLG